MAEPAETTGPHRRRVAAASLRGSTHDAPSRNSNAQFGGTSRHHEGADLARALRAAGSLMRSGGGRATPPHRRRRGPMHGGQAELVCGGAGGAAGQGAGVAVAQGCEGSSGASGGSGMQRTGAGPVGHTGGLRQVRGPFRGQWGLRHAAQEYVGSRGSAARRAGLQWPLGRRGGLRHAARGCKGPLGGQWGLRPQRWGRGPFGGQGMLRHTALTCGWG